MSPPIPGRFETYVIRHVHLEDHGRPRTSVSVDAVRRRYEKRADFVVIEDHDQFLAKTEARAPDALPGVIAGREYTPKTTNHDYGIIGVDATEAAKVRLGRRVNTDTLREVRAQEGVVIYNHPEYPKWIELSPREAEAIDAVEIMNDHHVVHNDPEANLRWRDRNFYSRGLFPAAVGGVDEHSNTSQTDRPSYTVALTKDDVKGEASVMNAIRTGATYVTRDRDIVFEGALDATYTLGERPTFTRGTKHTLDIELAKLPGGATVEIVRNGTSMKAEPTNGAWKKSITFTAERPGYFYVVVKDTEGRPIFVSSAFAYASS